MTLRSLREESVEPLAGRDDYEWVRAIAVVSVDPGDAANRRITDLALAPRGADGTVEFEADVRLLRPTRAGNGRLLAVVPNRGLIGGIPFEAGGRLELMELPSPGDGFLVDRGWSVLWCGWQWDVIDGLGVRAPLADVGAGWLRAEWRLDTPAPELELSDSSSMFRFETYPTADVDDADAVLSVRTAPKAERTLLPRHTWRFASATTVAVDGGFLPFHWYELVYRTTRCPIVGTGLLATRDVVAGVGTDYDHVLGYGVSQSGRFLRQFLWDGLNVDEGGRQVFDGTYVHLAGGRRGEFNHRYAQPSYTHVMGFSNLPPFDTTSILRRQRELGGVPKVIETNTAAEYWRGDGALVHVNPITGEDLPDDPDARHYLYAGLDHLGALNQMKQELSGTNPVHVLDPQLVGRALLLALDRWVSDGVEPPPSRVPRRHDGTAVSRREVLERFADASRPEVDGLTVTPRIDLGPNADHGIGRWPLQAGAPYVDLVSAVDEDGNEVAGIRLPEVATAVATFTGWNPRRPIEGLPAVAYDFLGSMLPLPPDRPSLVERYPDEPSYVAAATAAAATLVRDGFLLPTDVDQAVAAAVEMYRRWRDDSHDR